MFTIFTDESSQTQCRYMVLGGAIVLDKNLTDLNDKFFQVRYDQKVCK